ncbi:hypothetical protein FQN54_005514 [Arachnomyces sp. PD_36]|nr:hypothetical protein FQN54_005514 [Arachnomyces sp. PD_36]
MTSVDDLFKKPALPTRGSKRKFEPTQDPKEAYKSAKVDSNGDAKSGGRATVEDEEEDEGGVAGPDLPPDFDQEDVPDDEEGRFFGGGITSNTAMAMDYIEKQEDQETAPEKIDIPWLRRLALNFEKKISKNAELRAKFEDDPQKFMASEADLDADIKALSILSEHPELYGEFAKLGCVGSLVSLLAHENTDIAIDAIEILSELTDEDVETDQEQWDALVNAMVGVLENLSSKTTVAEKLGQESGIMAWLQGRIQKKESPVGQNKQYSAEILAILLQSSPKNRTRFTELDGVEILLQILSSYRKRDPPKDTEEEEYVENLFDCLTCVVDDNEGKEKFIDGEGIELAQIMLREGKMSKPRALRVLDHTLGGPGGARACEHFVEAAGLRTAFAMFMKKQESRNIEHILGLFSSLLRLLPGESAGRIRTLAKFMEKDYEKIGKLVKLRREYSSRVSPVDKAIQEERKSLPKEQQEEMADEWFSRRLDAGLFSLQTIDVILAWLVAEDDGAKSRIKTLLADQDEGLEVIRDTLQEQLDGLTGTEAGEQDTKDMLGTLLQFL